MRRAGVGSGRHGSDVSGFENEDSSGAGAAAGRRHVDDHGHRRSHDLVDNFPRRLDEASGSIHLDQNSLVVMISGDRERAGDVFGGDGLDGVVHRDPQDVGGARHSKKC